MKNTVKNCLIFILLCSCFMLVSCTTESTRDRTKEAIEWVNKHPKPIIVSSIKMNVVTGNYKCMFIDSAGVVFYAGEVEGFSPDTIR